MNATVYKINVHSAIQKQQTQHTQLIFPNIYQSPFRRSSVGLYTRECKAGRMSNPYESNLAKLKKVPPKEKPREEGTENALTTSSTYLAQLRKLPPKEEKSKNAPTSSSYLGKPRKAPPEEKPDQTCKEQTENAPPPSSTYEKIGVLDVSVYTSCDYQAKEEKNKRSTKVTPTRIWRGDWRVKLKIALLAVLAAVLAITLVTSFALGTAGVAIGKSPTKCRIEVTSTLLNRTSDTITGLLPITTGVSCH